MLGSIVLENYERENAFGESDVRLLTTVAASMGVALENARLFDETQRLLKETEQRNAELAVINSIQQGMAGELDFQAIVDLVGDKLREVLQTGGHRHPLVRPETRHGRTSCTSTSTAQRLTMPRRVRRAGSAGTQVIADAQPSSSATRAAERRGRPGVVPGTDAQQSTADGADHRQRPRRRHRSSSRASSASTPSARATCACSTTVAASMGVALENARLFDETQRLLKETEQRAAELAVINSIQEGMAAELDFQAIVDLVGDKLREVFRTGDIGIRWYDPQRPASCTTSYAVRARRAARDPRRQPELERHLGARRRDARSRSSPNSAGRATRHGRADACRAPTSAQSRDPRADRRQRPRARHDQTSRTTSASTRSASPRCAC